VVALSPRMPTSCPAPRPCARSGPDAPIAGGGAQLPVLMNLDGVGEDGSLVCGLLGCDSRPFKSLLETLQPILHHSKLGGAQQLAELIHRLPVMEAQ